MNCGFGFVDLLQAEFPNVASFPHTKVSHVDRVILQIRNSIPDVVIIQVGNYENPYPVYDRCIKKIARSFHLANLLKPLKYPYLRFVPFRTKIALDKILHLFGFGLANSYSFHEKYKRMLLKVAQAVNSRVLVIGLFPSPDPWINYGRSQANMYIQKLCKETALRYLDVFSILKDSESNVFGDIMHLNSKGHRILYDAVIPEITNILASVP